MFPRRFGVAAICAGLLLPLSLAGCSGAVAGSAGAKPAFVAGNWQISSTSSAAAPLPGISGEITGNPAALTGVLHAEAASPCVDPTKAFEVDGSANSAGDVTLMGSFAGGTLTIVGTLSADGRSLTDASYNVAGGNCAFARATTATAEAYAPLSGLYNGTFVDSDGAVATIQATLNQSPDANGDGNYTLSGSAGLPKDACFSSSSLTVTNTQVSGGSFAFTFADPVTQASVTAQGTFSTDAATLTVTQWTLSNCGVDSGTGSMTRP